MPRKRSNGEGSIYRDGDRWVAALVVGHREDGKPIRRRLTAKTRKEVAARLAEAQEALRQGLDIPDSSVTIAELAEWWLSEVLPHEGLAPKTVDWYQEMVRIVLPYVGNKRLTGPQALIPSDVMAMYPKLRTRATRTAARTTLSKMLRAAQEHGLVARNVARLSRIPGDEGKVRENKAHTAEEIKLLLGALEGTRWHPIVMVGVTTGLRPQELLALHWTDVHLNDAEPYVSVRWAMQYRPRLELKAPKRPRSYRTVPLVPEAVAALKAWRKTQAAERLEARSIWSPDWPDLVFTAKTGRPYHSVQRVRRAMQRVMPSTHPYRLRHTYATHLLEAGMPIHHVAELLGDTVVTVERNYSHVLRTKHEATQMISGLVGGG